MRLLVCGRSSLRRKPIEAVFQRGEFFGGIPRARVWWVVCVKSVANAAPAAP